MNRWYSSIILFLVLSLSTDISYAAGIIMRIQQMKKMKQQQSQGMTEEQYEQYQAQQQGGQAQGQQAAAPPTYQQTVDQRNQAIAQAILAAHSQAVSTESVPFGNTEGALPSVTQPTATQPLAQQQPGTGSSDVKEVVDMTDVWKKLDTKSAVWSLLIDDQAKVLTVSEYIDRYHKQGVKINEPPEHYVQMIDQIVQQNPNMLQRPFGELVQIVAVIDYDFDNGMNKDDLARKILGEAAFEENKKRFAQQAPAPQQAQQ